MIICNPDSLETTCHTCCMCHVIRIPSVNKCLLEDGNICNKFFINYTFFSPSVLQIAQLLVVLTALSISAPSITLNIFVCVLPVQRVFSVLRVVHQWMNFERQNDADHFDYPITSCFAHVRLLFDCWLKCRLSQNVCMWLHLVVLMWFHHQILIDYVLDRQKYSWISLGISYSWWSASEILEKFMVKSEIFNYRKTQHSTIRVFTSSFYQIHASDGWYVLEYLE